MVPYSGARTLDAFVEFLDQNTKAAATVSFFQLSLLYFSAFAGEFLGSLLPSQRACNNILLSLQEEEEEQDVQPKDEL